MDIGKPLIFATMVGATAIGGVGVQEHRQQHFDRVMTELVKVQEAQDAYRDRTGTWATDIQALVDQELIPQRPDDDVLDRLEMSPTTNGNLTISFETLDSGEANRLNAALGMAAEISDTRFSVTMQVPDREYLRNEWMRDRIDSAGSQVLPSHDLNLSGNNLYGMDALAVKTLSSNCLVLGERRLCDAGSGTISIDAAMTRATGDMEAVSSEVGSLTVEGDFSALKAVVTSLNAETAGLDKATLALAVLEEADIELLKANTAALQDFTAQSLAVAGQTQLGKLIADDASFESIVATAVQINGEAVIEDLLATDFAAEVGTMDRAEVETLISNVVRVATLKSEAINSRELLADQVAAARAVLSTIEGASLSVEDLMLNEATVGTLRGSLATVTTGNVVTLVALNSHLNEVVAETVVTQELTAEKTKIGGQLSADQVAVLGQLSTATLNADSGEVLNNTVINGVALIGELTATNELHVRTLLKALNVVLQGDLDVGGLLSAAGLEVHEDFQVGSLQVGRDLDVAARLKASLLKSTSVEVDDLAVASALTIRNQLTANTLQSSTHTAGEWKISGAGNINSLTAGNAAVSGRVTAKDLAVIGSYSAGMIRASLWEQAGALSFSSASGQSLSLTGEAQAGKASHSAVVVSGRGAFGSISAGSGIVRGPLTAGAISGKTAQFSSTAAANKVKTGGVSATTVSASSAIVAQNAIASGGSLLGLASTHNNHEGRITAVEQFKVDCVSNWTGPCVGTVPVLASPSCQKCSREQTGLGFFEATAVATIKDCPQGCDYSWNVGWPLRKSACTNGSVPGGSTKTVSCRFNHPGVAEGTTWSGAISLNASHGDRSSLKADTSYAVRFKNNQAYTPLDDVQAGCYVDTMEFDVTTTNSCGSSGFRVKGNNAAILFSVGDIMGDDHRYFSSGEFETTWSGACTVRGSNQCIAEGTCSNGFCPPLRAVTVTVTVKYKGMTRSFTINANDRTREYDDDWRPK